jgi:hypothetical protein
MKANVNPAPNKNPSMNFPIGVSFGMSFIVYHLESSINLAIAGFSSNNLIISFFLANVVSIWLISASNLYRYETSTDPTAANDLSACAPPGYLSNTFNS